MSRSAVLVLKDTDHFVFKYIESEHESEKTFIKEKHLTKTPAIPEKLVARLRKFCKAYDGMKQTIDRVQQLPQC